MLYSEDDVKKAVEAARQLVLHDWQRGPTSQFIRLRDDTPDSFYARVLEFARKAKP